MERCFVPSEILTHLHPAVAAFGEVAEYIIKLDYCRSKGGCQEYLTPGAQTDFFDVAMGFSRCRHLAAYLKTHHPHLDETRLAGQCEMKKDSGASFPVPDIITFQPPGRTEFYEIKPNSASGRRAGRDKIIWFEIICRDESLPYAAGSQYSPDRRVVVWNGTWLGSPVKVRLHWFLDQRGLLLYELCVEVSQETFAEMLVKSLLRFVILALILLLRNPAAVAAAVATVLASVTSPLRRPVGQGGVNAPPDVAYAQLLLGDWRQRHGLPALVVDGISGPRTREAITEFQRTATGVADGRLDPGKRGIRTLEQEHLAATAAGAAVAVEELAGVRAPEPWEITVEGLGEDGEGAVSQITTVDLDLLTREELQGYLDGLYLAAGELIG
jgi:hypothetical protein